MQKCTCGLKSLCAMFDMYWFLNLYDLSGGFKSVCAMFDTLTCTHVQRIEVVHMDNSAAKMYMLLLWKIQMAKCKSVATDFDS